jgi:hypothetical protein
LISWRGDAGYSGVQRPLWLRPTRGVGDDGRPRGAQRRGAWARRCRSRADLLPVGAEVISSLGNNITHPGGAWFILVTTGSPVRTSLTGAAMGSGRPWRRCSAGRSWIGWASQRAAMTAAITATNVDDSTTFGAVLEDVPPIRTPSTTLARRGTAGRGAAAGWSSHSRARCQPRSPSSLGGRRRGEEDQQGPDAHHQRNDQ